MHRPRPRRWYLATCAAVVGLGLAARELRDLWPSLVTAYLGDTLWPVVFFLLFAALWRRASTAALAAAVLGLTVAIEASQLYDTPWIDSVRATRVGRLLLGNTFLWSDLVCLLVGTGLAVAVDRMLRRMTRSPSCRTRK